ncbi:MAG: hypothetical protein RL885_22210 [Planctomycetota bacterium]
MGPPPPEVVRRSQIQRRWPARGRHRSEEAEVEHSKTVVIGVADDHTVVVDTRRSQVPMDLEESGRLRARVLRLRLEHLDELPVLPGEDVLALPVIRDERPHGKALIVEVHPPALVHPGDLGRRIDDPIPGYLSGCRRNGSEGHGDERHEDRQRSLHLWIPFSELSAV